MEKRNGRLSGSVHSVCSSVKAFNRTFSALALGVLVACGSSAHALDYISCGGPAAEFEENNFFLNWSVNDAEGNGTEWETLAECGLPNHTGSSGEAKCVNIGGFGMPAYDTTIQTNEFSLEGADSAVLEFDINYQDMAAGGDTLDIEVKDGMNPWVTLVSVDWDVGVLNGAGIHAALPLNAFLGSSDVKVRFRYYDSTGGGDSGVYAQIDNVSLSCIGGADLEASMTPDKAVVLEGEEVTWTFDIINNGPKAATDVMAMGSAPRGFNILSSQISQGIMLPATSATSLGAMVGVLGNGSSATATIVTRAGIVPEVHLQVNNPPALAGGLEAKGAAFGPEINPASPLSGLLVVPDDGMGTTDDGCEPFNNADEVAGNIALMIETGPCENDERVKNAQDAGAVGAIVWSDNPILPIPFLPILAGYTQFAPMVPSGNVVVPITIPSIKVGYESGAALKLNIVNSVQVEISGAEVLSQEAEAFGFTLGDEFDPDFSLAAESTNNVVIGKVVVLKDSDKDGTANLDDSCPYDAAKIEAGVCGCGISDADSDGDGIADCNDLCPVDASKTTPGACGCNASEVDANANGIMDCDINADAKQMLSDLHSLVRKLKKGKKPAKELRKQLKSLSSTLFPTLTASAEFFILTDGSVDLAKLSKQGQKAVKKSRNTKSQYFSRNKKKALRALKKLQKQIA